MWAELLKRINYRGTTSPNLACLFSLHEHHVRSVPFENLDVQNQVKIQLQIPHLLRKIGLKKRGGFCYELNYLFYQLLSDIGFEVSMISARVYDQNEPGPEFDHLALVIALEGRMLLADVGFGDLFVTPIEIIDNKVQFDGRNYFKLVPLEESWLLWMSADGKQFEKKYQFSTVPRSILEFQDQCQFKQFSPNSYFVKNTVVTLPTEKGRKTIFNEKFIIKTEGERKDHLVEGAGHRKEVLAKEFNIHL